MGNTYGPEVTFDFPGGADYVRPVQAEAGVELGEVQRYVGDSDLVTDALTDAVRHALREGTNAAIREDAPLDIMRIERSAARTEIRVRFPEPASTVERKASKTSDLTVEDEEDDENDEE